MENDHDTDTKFPASDGGRHRSILGLKGWFRLAFYICLCLMMGGAVLLARTIGRDGALLLFILGALVLAVGLPVIQRVHSERELSRLMEMPEDAVRKYEERKKEDDSLNHPKSLFK